MRFSNITIDGFGVLSNLEVPKLSDGLNVIYGTNGSGKTTLLHFIRGVLSGFGDARRLKLLPPIKGGNPGGSITVAYGAGTYEVIRRSRTDETDTLAINLKSGQSPEADQLREDIENLDHDLLKTVFAVGGYESHAVKALIKLALRDNIELSDRSQHADWLTAQIEQLEIQRKDLFTKHPETGRIADLEQKRNRLFDAIALVQNQQRNRQDTWGVNMAHIEAELVRLQKEANWLHIELQLAQTELTEVNDRLWSKRQTVEYDQQTIEHPQLSAIPGWVEEIKAIDGEISHAQQVLRDLATSRMELSIAKAGLTGSETPDHEVVFERHRQAIHAIELQTERLQGVLNRIDQAKLDQTCVCQEMKGTVGNTLESIRQQISLLCQELSRQQTTHEQMLLNFQREGVDRCELELTKQIHRLRLRRDEILHGGERTMSERVQFCTKHETVYCLCEDHQRYLNSLPTPFMMTEQAPEFITTERIITTSNARPGDSDRQLLLINRIEQLRKQWWNTNAKLRDARSELKQLQREPELFAQDQSVQKVRYEYAVVEQQLADAREQWQSLVILQSVLHRTQDRLTINTHSQVIQDGSDLLHKMTEGRYVGFRFYADPEHGFGPDELVVVSDSGRELPMDALSRGTLDQAALAFRMALWSEYQRRGIKLPLILDDVLPDSDESRLHAAASALVEFGNRHHQMVFFTCQEHLANMFETMQAKVWDIPGSVRKHPLNRIVAVPTREPVSPFQLEVKPLPKPRPLPLLPAKIVQAPAPKLVTLKPVVLQQVAPATPVEAQNAVEAQNDNLFAESTTSTQKTVAMYRIQPDEPFWLQTNSPSSYVPSLGAQMARRLGALGVRHVSDLIELDPEATDIPLENLQISAATLRTWQAEARLLCCVPDLTGRDAQLLVACGIMNPSELAEADATDLFNRIQQVRSEYQSGALSWLSDRPHWPEREAVSTWIKRGRAARTYSQARDWSTQRRFRNNGNSHTHTSRNGSQRTYTERTAHDRTPRQFETHEPHNRSNLIGEHTNAAQRVQQSREEFVEQEISDSNDREWKFYLHMDSPVVDAPTIGPRMAERLKKIGISTVSDLVNRSANEITEKLNHKRTTLEDVIAWQQQSILVCRIPQLRGHDAQVLVACGVTEPEALASHSPEKLFEIVSPFSNSKEGQRLLRSAKTPDLEEVTDWIAFAQNSRLLKVA